MTEKEVKTLKDIKKNLEKKWVKEVKSDSWYSSADEFKEKLRQEVINHIKSGRMVEGAKFWAIYFFNITKEDLR